MATQGDDANEGTAPFRASVPCFCRHAQIQPAQIGNFLLH
jgi:hypothetical protein